MPGAFDHLDRPQSGKRDQHPGEGAWAGGIGRIDQRGAGTVDHAKRAEAGDSAKITGIGAALGDEALAARIGGRGVLDHLDADRRGLLRERGRGRKQGED